MRRLSLIFVLVGAGWVLVRIERRGQLDEIDVPRCRESDVRARADHGGSDESPHAGEELGRRRGNQFLWRVQTAAEHGYHRQSGSRG